MFLDIIHGLPIIHRRNREKERERVIEREKDREIERKRQRVLGYPLSIVKIIHRLPIILIKDYTRVTLQI